VFLLTRMRGPTGRGSRRGYRGCVRAAAPDQPTKEEPMGEVYLSLSMSLDGFVAGPGDEAVEAPEGVTSLRFRNRR
jgi:hypothetical protein